MSRHFGTRHTRNIVLHDTLRICAVFAYNWKIHITPESVCVRALCVLLLFARSPARARVVSVSRKTAPQTCTQIAACAMCLESSCLVRLLMIDVGGLNAPGRRFQWPRRWLCGWWLKKCIVQSLQGNGENFSCARLFWRDAFTRSER